MRREPGASEALRRGTPSGVPRAAAPSEAAAPSARARSFGPERWSQARSRLPRAAPRRAASPRPAERGPPTAPTEACRSSSPRSNQVLAASWEWRGPVRSSPRRPPRPSADRRSSAYRRAPEQPPARRPARARRDAERLRARCARAGEGEASSRYVCTRGEPAEQPRVPGDRRTLAPSLTLTLTLTLPLPLPLPLSLTLTLTLPLPPTRAPTLPAGARASLLTA